ncbi:gamma-glutamylcyclotransferase [Plakobranchus ocellatus]|uniref:glutathione-specific gamma-glutamylcyclotransferase n=1 Tax=Plakobranchus ocellatus TaxID=259542 RepID=A0AAV3YWU8_9GAST|nr:gamma-glutamylcyclotransferase [Plakobranchus ocellatus]
MQTCDLQILELHIGNHFKTQLQIKRIYLLLRRVKLTAEETKTKGRPITTPGRSSPEPAQPCSRPVLSANITMHIASPGSLSTTPGGAGPAEAQRLSECPGQDLVEIGSEQSPECSTDVPDEQPTLWVFGYGSLMWKPDFAFRSKQVGYIKGYVRRFHQGNVTFRGRPGKPGRVANLEQDDTGQTWGVAFEIHGEEEVNTVLKALYTREVVSGGYVMMTTEFYPRENHLRKPSAGSCDSLSSLCEEGEAASPQDVDTNISLDRVPCLSADVERKKSIQVLVCTVTQECDLYLGYDEVDNMASQIVSASGSAGTNVEYVTKTADYVRMHIPEDEDSHLFQLDAKVRELVYRAHARNAGSLKLDLSEFAHMFHETYPESHPESVKAS